MIIVKCTSTTGNWAVYHNGLTSAAYNVKLNTTAIQVSDATVWNSTAPTNSVFSVGTSPDTNGNGATYVAYIYAHNAGGFGTTGGENIISCGTFTGSSTVNLGYEPQHLLVKNATALDSWYVMDNIRDFTSNGYSSLIPNTTGVEVTGATGIKLTSTGFTQTIGSTNTYIYMAIRRPNKPPTVGTQVYNAIARTGTGAAATVTGVGFPPDALFSSGRSQNPGVWVVDRLRGYKPLIGPVHVSIEDVTLNNECTGFTMDGVTLGTSATQGLLNFSPRPMIEWFFKRAPSVFDIVCYTGTGVANTIPHNLSVMPELIIIKSRSFASTTGWLVYCSGIANTEKLYLNLTDAKATDTTAWNSTSPTSSGFTVGTNVDCNKSAITYVAYLFATLAGISKVGAYTGNGTSQTIACGFTTGARFILIKCTSAIGDWFIWDTVRGIIAGNDPHVSLNTTAVEVTTDDSVDPDASGFIVNQLAATNINVTSATYIFLAIA